MSKLTILLVDDHETVREGLKVILNAQADMEVIAEADDGNQAVTQAQAWSPDLVVMDVSMPRVNGLKATETLRQSCPDVKVLVLTRHASEGYVHQLMRAGANGYVLKQSRIPELLHGIRAVARGGTYLDPAIADRVLGTLGRRVQPSAMAANPDISPREEEILRLVAWGYSNKEIAARLNLSVKTIETHKTNAMHKLNLQNRIDVVKFALLCNWLHDN
jgi:two-component system, NarL family, response regulator NreC